MKIYFDIPTKELYVQHRKASVVSAKVTYNKQVFPIIVQLGVPFILYHMPNLMLR